MPAMRPKRPAPPKNKRARKDEGDSDTTLDVIKKAVAADAEKLRAQEERYRKLIENAPRIAKERQQRQRDEYVTRLSKAEGRPRSPAALPDRRYDVNTGVVRVRHLRVERNRGRFMFFILLLVFAAVIAWLYFTMVKGGI